MKRIRKNIIAVCFLCLLAFSLPTMLISCTNQPSANHYSKLSELNGKTIGSLTGSTYDEYVLNKLDDVKIIYYDTSADQVTALLSGKVDAIVNEEPSVVEMSNENPNICMIDESLGNCNYASVFSKNDHGGKLRDDYSAFIREAEKNGTMDELKEIWFGNDDGKKAVRDVSELPNINGMIYVTTDASYPPLEFVKDGVITGYEIDLLIRYCESRGYALNIKNAKFATIIADVVSGKADIGVGCVIITPERSESVLFSEPNYRGKVVLAVKSTESGTSGFLAGIKDSFYKTFIKEERWKLFADGVLNTMLITVGSIVFGIVLGFVSYFCCSSNIKVLKIFTQLCLWLVEGLPMVVLLMVMYYLVFNFSGMSSSAVSVVAFSLTFGASVFGLLQTGVSAVDPCEAEAAVALGYSRPKMFLRVILPQAILHSLPIFKSEVKTHIKATAIVGYIAVQDLTKMCDIVRSRTYDAFFPLIATAVIYLVLETLFSVAIIKLISLIDPKKRSKSKILKGIAEKNGY